MENLIHGYQEKMISDGASALEDSRKSTNIRPDSPQSPSSAQASAGPPPSREQPLQLSRPIICLIVDNLPANVDKKRFENIMTRRQLQYETVTLLSTQESVQFGPKATVSAKITFSNRDDLIVVAKELVAKQSLKIESNVLQMRILKDKAQFNPATSVFVRNLNPGCTELELIFEINQIFKYNLTYRNELLKWDRKQLEKAQATLKSKKKKIQKTEIYQYFVLGCLIIKNRQTLLSKRIAFIDFECAEAANVVIKAWNQRNMDLYPNKLDVTLFDHKYIKMTLEQRQERSKTRERQFTNLFVSGLPNSMVEKVLHDIFFQYGEVKSVKMKRPNPYAIDHGATSSAYINFETSEEARNAMDQLNGKQLVPGSNKVRIEFYRRDNKFLGVHKGLNRQELINNTHYRVIFIQGLYLNVTHSQIREICEKYGEVDTVTLKTKIEFEKVVSKGCAIIQFSSKEGASNALKNLHFEDSLGEVSKIFINFYQSKESRQKELKKEQENAFMKQSALNIDSEPFQQMINNVKGSEEIMGAIKVLQDRFISYAENERKPIQQENQSSVFPQVAAISSQYYPPAPPVDSSQGPNYVIRRIVPPLKLNKLNTNQRQNRYNAFQTPSSTNYQSQTKTTSTRHTQQRSHSTKRVPAQRYHIYGKQQPPVPVMQQQTSPKNYPPKLTYQVKKQPRSKPQVDDGEIAMEYVKKATDKIEEIEQKQKPKTQRVVRFDDNVSKISLKIDMASVYSQKSKDLDEELRAQRAIQKYMDKRAGPEPKDMVEPEKSWRNRSKSRQDSGRQGNGSRSNSKRFNPRDAYAANEYPGFSKNSPHRQPNSNDQRKTSDQRKVSTSPKHSYSPRYLEYLFKSPDNSPREKELMRERIKALSPRDEREEDDFAIPLSNQRKTQNFKMPLPPKNQLNPFDSKPFKPPKLLSQVNKHLPISSSQVFDQNQLDVNRINQGIQGFKTDFNADSPVTLEGIHKILNYDSPQPCVSPSSLINIIPEAEGLSAPLYYPTSFGQQSKGSYDNGNGGGKEEEKKEPFGLFDWNWDDEDTDGKSSQNKPQQDDRIGGKLAKDDESQ